MSRIYQELKATKLLGYDRATSQCLILAVVTGVMMGKRQNLPIESQMTIFKSKPNCMKNSDNLMKKSGISKK